MTTVGTLISELPLKEMDSTLLTSAIIQKLDLFVPPDRKYEDIVYHAIDIAAYLHRDDLRSNRRDMPKTHYIEHPLRNALRYLRYGGTNFALLIAIILHDTVEDHATEYLELEYAGADLDRRQNESSEFHRMWAFEYIEETFGVEVRAYVQGMTNTLPIPNISKIRRHERYREHVIIECDRNAFVCIGKVMDYIDNAVGLFHNDVAGKEGMVKSLASKYEPLADYFIVRMGDDDVVSLLPDESRARIIETLKLGETRLREILGRKP